MYDRKTWVILTICGSLLAANFYYMSQNQRAQAEIRAREEKLQKTAEPAKVPVTTTAELTVEASPPATEEEFVVLENDKMAFTLTNSGGGVKYADFKTEFEVGSKTNRVRSNRFGGGPIGGLAGADEALENIPYTYKPDESVVGKKAVYIAKLPSG